MFTVYSTGPATGKLKPQWLRLSGSCEWCATNFLKQPKDFLCMALIRLQPVSQIV
ncbi:hypothetical protein GMSM_22240 [Geomonas sp. Red276]